jgi:hypothetical protein
MISGRAEKGKNIAQTIMRKNCKKFVNVFIDSLYLNARPAKPNEKPKHTKRLRNNMIRLRPKLAKGNLPKTNDMKKKVTNTFNPVQRTLVKIRETNVEK